MIKGRRQGGSDRVRDLDRDRGLAWIEALAADGTIRGDEEKKIRVRRVRAAVTRDDLDAALAGLPPIVSRLKAGDLRASNDDRGDAVRRLRAHEAYGHLDAAEADHRAELVSESRTLNEITTVFVDLPELQSAERSVARRVTDDERLAAIQTLDTAQINGQLTDDEHSAKIAMVDAARTRTEIRAALRGIKDPFAVAAKTRASEIAAAAGGHATRGVAEGARRVRAALPRLVVAIASIPLAVIVGVTAGLVPAMICLGVGVLLFMSAVRLLFRRRR